MQELRQTLVLFAREPVPGRVKTRLAQLLSAEGASRLYRAFLEDASRVYADPAWGSVVDAEPDPDLADLAAIFPPPWRHEQQATGDLGTRLTAAFDRERALGATVTLAVGSDHPALTRGSLRFLFDSVAGGSDAALIPAGDGGYCAIALSSAVEPATVFRDVPWSTPATLETTLARLREEGLSVSLAAPAYDVDRPEDLDRLRSDLARRDPAEEDYPRATSAALALLPNREYRLIPVLDSREMRAADRAAIRSGTPAIQLMENAARGIAEAIVERFPAWRRVVVVCGPGNNGGDGLAAARLLARRGLSVRVFTLRDPGAYRGAAQVNAKRARDAGLVLESLAKERGVGSLSKAAAEGDGVVDALFGIGLDRPLRGLAARVVSAINAAGRPVVAADVPSGLVADTGSVHGPSVVAAVTVAFGAPKVCHAFPPARRRCGKLVVHDIGIPKGKLARKSHRLFLATAEAVRGLLPARDPAGHKGDFGRVAVVAGSRGKAGAAILAARGALRGGAGTVTVFCPDSVGEVVVSHLPEAMTEALTESPGEIAGAGAELAVRLEAFDVTVVGPGLGTSEGTVASLRGVIGRMHRPVVLDADGLNAFAGDLPRLARRRAPTLLTPHPGEAARLLGASPRAVQADRVTAARTLARRARCAVLLKGEATLLATPDGRVVVNPTGTPLLATAGSGDVLAGLIGALVGGGLEVSDAATAAAWLHGAAGEALAERLGDAGLLAHEIADAVPEVRRTLRRHRDVRRET